MPLVDCRWNDVVHLCPVPPFILRRELEVARGAAYEDRTWFKVPISAIQGIPAVAFQSVPRPYSGPFSFPPECFKWFEPDSYREIHEVADATKRYYRDEFAVGRRPLVFNGLLHVLVKGSIEVSRCSEIEW